MFCPLCKAEYREGFTRCADCDVELVLSLPTEDSEVAFRGLLERARLCWQEARRTWPVKLCPLCKAEYREEFTWCKDCNCSLVGSPEELERNPPVVACCGVGPLNSEPILKALADANIAHSLLVSAEPGDNVFHPVFKLGPVAFRFGLPLQFGRGVFLRVLKSDLDATESIVKELAATRTIQEVVEEKESVGSPGGELDSQDSGLSEWDRDDWDRDWATVEVWYENFLDSNLTGTIAELLSHAKVRLRILTDKNGRYLLVVPSDEMRARQLLHEVTGSS